MRSKLELNSWLIRSPYTDTTRLDDPELMVDPMHGQNSKNPGQHLKNLSSTRFGGSKYDDADVLVRWIRPKVGEVQIKGEEHSPFRLARCPDSGIFRTAQPFVVNGVAIPTGSAKKIGGLNWHVLVEFRAHARTLRRKG